MSVCILCMHTCVHVHADVCCLCVSICLSYCSGTIWGEIDHVWLVNKFYCLSFCLYVLHFSRDKSMEVVHGLSKLISTELFPLGSCERATAIKVQNKVNCEQAQTCLMCTRIIYCSIVWLCTYVHINYTLS